MLLQAKNNTTVSQEDLDELEMCIRVAEHCKRGRKPYDNDWDRFYRFFRNRHWEKEKLPKWRAKITFNYCFSALQYLCSLVTDNRTHLYVDPIYAGEVKQEEIAARETRAKLYDHIISQIQTDNAWELQEFLTALTTKLYGGSWKEVLFDPELDNGLGNVTVTNPNVWNMYPDPDVPIFEDNLMRYICKISQEDTVELKNKYPDEKDQIYSDNGLVDLRNRIKEVRDTITPASDHLNSIYPNVTPTIGQSQAPEGKTTVLKIWFNPKFMSDKDKKVYPNGKLVEICGSMILNKEAHEYPYWNPFVYYPNYPVPFEPHGISELENIIDVNFVLDKTISWMADHMSQTGNAIWIMDDNCQVDRNKLVNRAGLVIKKRHGTDIHRDAAPPLPQYFMEVMQIYIQIIQEMTGLKEVLGGKNPPQVTSGVAIDSLQQSANVRIRAFLKYFEASEQKTGQKIVDLISTKFVGPRWYNIFNLKTGQYETMKWEEVEGEDKWKVGVRVGSTLPNQKSAMEDKAFKLYGAGLIDQQALLEEVDFPNVKAIAERMKNTKRNAAAADITSQAAKMGINVNQPQGGK